ncbi:hypothetical protein X943_002613 [Babesia divergens]|uniref:Uncharacterized protein n=1 Tax=Babesia divergens TaxID=32595 RepID=A0AAD9GHN0_BABDI|nr:hypothetical protein X943_002613 [Babesia divergens]
MGRGLHNLQHKAEAMMLRLWLTLTKDESRSVRRAAICQHYRSSHHRVSLIVQELKDDYGLDVLPQDPIEKAIHELRVAQNKKLYDVIQTKTNHGLFYNMRGTGTIDYATSSLWMRKSMLNPQEEAKLVNLQDRNLAWMSLTGTHRGCGRAINVGNVAIKMQQEPHTEAKIEERLQFQSHVMCLLQTYSYVVWDLKI